MSDDLTIGIEEEYLLVDRATRDLVADQPPELMKACEERLGDHVSPEFLRCQIEIGTPVCRTVAEARGHLAFLRRVIAEEAAKHGIAPIAASTHPFAKWSEQKPTQKPRYEGIAESLQTVGRRLMICGMHVHVAVADPELRIDLHSQLTYFLPHLLALSCSSPFWEGRPAGLKSYRLAVYDALPRSGLPERFTSFGEFERTVDMLVKAGAIEDATKIWWDLRPSVKFPTLESRITDVSTRMEDGLAIAAAFQCLTRMLIRLRRKNQRWRYYPTVLIAENRWLAQRHGVSGSLIDCGRGEAVPFAELADELIDLLAEDADALQCSSDLQRLRRIVGEGTSADRQLAVFEAAQAEGADEREAFVRVVDHLIAETVEGIDEAPA